MEYNTTSCNLSTNDWKGYYFEVRVQKRLLELGIEFIGNPRDPTEWKRHIAKGPDIMIPQLGLQIECKAAYSPVWPSSIKPHYIKRFTTENSKIVVTNDTHMYNDKCRSILQKASIKLMNLFHLIQYLFKLLTKHPRANTISGSLVEDNYVYQCFKLLLRTKKHRLVPGRLKNVTLQEDSLSLNICLVDGQVVRLALPEYMVFYKPE